MLSESQSRSLAAVFLFLVDVLPYLGALGLLKEFEGGEVSERTKPVLASYRRQLEAGAGQSWSGFVTFCPEQLGVDAEAVLGEHYPPFLARIPEIEQYEFDPERATMRHIELETEWRQLLREA